MVWTKGQKIDTGKKCTHKIPISTGNGKTILEQETSTEAGIESTTERALQAQYKDCHCPALKDALYCRLHIRLYPEYYAQWLNEQQRGKTGIQSISRLKYRFATEDLRRNYAEKLTTGNKLLDLRQDIALLTALLEALINSNKHTTKEVIAIIDLQRKCINTMNDLRKTQANIMTQDKTEILLNRIVEVIKKRVEDGESKRLIGVDLIEIANEYKDA